jgi:hypothetical protein
MGHPGVGVDWEGVTPRQTVDLSDMGHPDVWVA